MRDLGQFERQGEASPLRNGSGSEDRTVVRRDPKGNKLRGLWLGFASVQSPHDRGEEGRCDGATSS